jgi:hypothetical protein
VQEEEEEEYLDSFTNAAAAAAAAVAAALVEYDDVGMGTSAATNHVRQKVLLDGGTHTKDDKLLFIKKNKKSIESIDVFDSSVWNCCAYKYHNNLVSSSSSSSQQGTVSSRRR